MLFDTPKPAEKPASISVYAFLLALLEAGFVVFPALIDEPVVILIVGGLQLFSKNSTNEGASMI